ncbi:MAG: ATP-binding protein [Bacteroidetes bacterium SB0662_bin_6]|nr:ATP-binding protein [Bacteroidetes bacterium SB0668_bin_1]MYE03952.1 ATP-binding protein [Bacteroidetes bacterium SB0662_bin_6]
MIRRDAHIKALEQLISRNPVVALLGARQVGKTTLARELAGRRSGPTHLFDLESTADLARLADPLLALSSLRGLIILDEIQHRPELFPTLRVLSDRAPAPARFLVLGSASPSLLRQSSESLAGRIAYYELPGLSLSEVTVDKADLLWLWGGFPRSFTAHSHQESYRWRGDFLQTFLAQDIPQFGITVSGALLDRFWSMLAHYHAQTWNGSELGRAFGVSHHAVRRYLDILEATFMVRSLKPWSANLAKRQVKSPKIYLRDSGLLHRFLNVTTRLELARHPKIGASWEGFILENLIQALGVEDRQCYFWGTHSGAEIDLVVQQGAGLRGFEIKRTTAPAVTPSMRSALDDLKLNRIDVIHAGAESFPLAKRIHAVAASRLLKDI